MAAKKSVIDRLVVELSADTSRFNRGMRNLERSIRRTGQNITAFGRRLTRTMLATFTGITVASLKLANDYEMAMNRVRAVTGATQLEMEGLEQTALILGRTTARSAREVAQGMEALGLAGFSTQQIEDSIRAVTSLSVIAQQDMMTSARNAANLMSQFKIEADDLESAIDILASTITSSNQDIEDLVNGLKFAGPIAYQAGASLGEVSAAMGILANNGIRAGIAGRQLRMGFLNLMAPSAGAKEEMRRLGLVVTDSEGSLLDLDTILGNLNQSFEGMSDVQRTASLRTLFGTRAMSAMTMLLEAQADATDDGSNAFSKYVSELENSTGKAAEMEEILLRGLPGALILLRSATEGALLTLKELYEDHIVDAIRWLINLLNAFSDLEKGRSVIINYITDFKRLGEDVGTIVGYLTKRFDDMIERLFGIEDVTTRVVNWIIYKWRQFVNFLESEMGFIITGELTHGAIADMGLLVLAVGPLIMILGKAVVAFSSVLGIATTVGAKFAVLAIKIGVLVGPTALGALKTALAFLAANPLVAVLAALAAVSIAFAATGDSAEDFAAMIDEKINGIGEIFQDIFTSIVNILGMFADFFNEIFEDISDGPLEELLSKLGLNLVEILLTIVEIIAKVLLVNLNFIAVVIETILKLLEPAMPVIEVFLIAVVWLINEIATVLNNVLKLLSMFVDMVVSVMSDFANAFINYWKQVWEDAKMLYELFGRTFTDFFSNLWENATNLVTAWFEAIKNIIIAVPGLFTMVTDSVKNAFFTVINSIIGGLNTLTGMISNALSIKIDALNIDVGVNIPKIPEIDVPGAASGAFVKKTHGGQMFVVGEGNDDELISPIPMLQALLDEALKNSQKSMLELFKSATIMGTAFDSMGTHITPMSPTQKQNTSAGVTINNTNNFSIDGNIGLQVQEALKKQERESRLRFRGVKV